MIPAAARATVVLAGVVAAAALGARSTRAPARAGVFADFGEPLPGGDAEARARFERGRGVALRRFAPSSGLGPEYSGVSCGDCHEKPVTGGGASRYRTVFVAAGGKPSFVVPFEHHFTADGVAAARATSAALRVPPPFFGAGLLSEIPPEEIASRADPSDKDGDGISGKVNFERGFIGRFGRKAQMATLEGFVRLALLDHMGVTTKPVAPPYLAERDAPVGLATHDADGVPDPELLPEDLGDLLAFVALLAPPAPNPPNRETRAGAAIFASSGCTGCHTPALNGPRGPIAAYTDLLLHDMGKELADGVAVGEAKGSEFRTQPLWGLAAGGPYLHDGRADTIDEAIRAHGGEAERARTSYVALPAAERAKVLAFLESLGGRDRTRSGLLPKNAPIAPPGTLGGPEAPLAPGDAARFTRGRALFDHDFARAEGLGPRFNGDACRSCHFDPVLGGAGPSDVDVLRSSGADTLEHKFELGGRPVLDGQLTRRQTPPLFGLGLVDAIPDLAILARADPDDRDGDGVRGVASVLADGRVGRFGWKAQQPTLAAFVADALANELGMTDGEIPRGEVDGLVFFLGRLAPPPRRGAPDAAVFARLGCAACHAPSLTTTDGRAVPLYSDLLLHDAGGGGPFRTPPLWGIGASAPYFHDGRAETLEAAVLRHDGEARSSRDRYANAGAADRTALIGFLRSL